ncbi:hypothetical protein AURDEDRAFT_182106 [Auricularia subglabra TFB-10046 SS5]|nr:hypothetical protein AURDEDRAFT_182106 [Auricularia subglabra TFB-10046 SS5]
MSDAFSDLWKTAHPTQNTSNKPSALKDVRPQQTASPPPWARQAAKTDAFSILASASPKPSLGSVTPQRQNAPPAKPASRSGDAFSDLVSIGAQSNSSKLSLAAAAQQSRPASSLAQSQPATQPASSGALWDQLDMLGCSSTPPTTSVSRMSTGASQSSATNDLWDMDLLGGAPAQSQATPSITQSPPTPQRATAAPSSSASSNVFDLLGDFGGPAPARSSPSPRLSPDPPASRNATRSSTPASFDFGDREDFNADVGNASDDDILGMLGQPVKAVRQRTSPAPEERRPPRTTSRTSPAASGRSSPPPHVIGQIVEMGFTPGQARVALASTATGVDVQAALETLLQNGAAGSEGAAEPSIDRNSSDDEERRERERRRRHAERRRRPATEQHEPAEALGGADSLQVQADKLLNQASEIGMSMFSKANAFWNSGKERVQKAYEERTAAAAVQRPSNSSSPAPGKARPRWMATEGDGDLASPVGDGGSAFRDGSDDDAPAPPPRRAPMQPPTQSTRAPPTPVQSNGTGSSARKFLFDDSQPSGGYVSAFRGTRRGQQSNNASPQPTRGSSPARSLAPAAPPPPTFAAALPSALTAAAAHKATANESFKLGAYPAAITAYSAALGVLPEGHMARVALLNNRALASIRIGEWKNAIEDCSTAISLIRPANASGSSYLGTVPVVGSQAEGTNLPGETLHLGDALLKALSRRAAAHEMGEKWPSALADWDAVLQAALMPMAAGGGDIGKSRGEALRGSERCKKMVGIVADPASAPAPAPAPARPARRPAPKPATANAPPSEAVQRVRAANAATSAEDQQKSELKDGVDARLQAWKGGKETNIRALIASLDSVLWPELGWQTVGMAELISPKQLKVRYMKAIAKLHPDKLNVDNTTVEQRMIANGVFATLNEAWVASNSI